MYFHGHDDQLTRIARVLLLQVKQEEHS